MLHYYVFTFPRQITWLCVSILRCTLLTLDLVFCQKKGHGMKGVLVMSLCQADWMDLGNEIHCKNKHE